MLVWPLPGYGGWLASGTRLLGPLSLMTNSLCVGSKATSPVPVVSTRGRTAFAALMSAIALRVVAVVALIGTGRDAVAANLTVTLSAPRRATGPSARIFAAALSSLEFSAGRVSVLGMRRLAATCWPSRCS
jgi:hypothetical protein